MNWRRVNSSISARSKVSSDMTVNLDNSMGDGGVLARINQIPRYIPRGKTVTIQFANGRYVFNRILPIKGFYGSGTLALQGNMSEPSALYTGHGVELDFSPVGTSGLYFEANQCQITVDKLMISSNISGVNDYLVYINLNGGYVQFRYCRILNASGTGYLMVFRSSKGYVLNTYFDGGYAAVTASENAITYLENNASAGGVTNTYPYISVGATLIGITGTSPSAANNNTPVNGGQFA